MARPKCCRRIGEEPSCRFFKPVGIPLAGLDQIVLSLDEFEAMRLADLEGLYHEQAAARMNVSRQTFGRIVASARKKVACALEQGLALRIEGGIIETPEKRPFQCNQCNHTWEITCGTGKPTECPRCDSKSIMRSDCGVGLKGKGNCEVSRCHKSESWQDC